jgi:phage tail P2-like protein
MIDIRTASLIDSVPESIRDESEIVALSAAIDTELRAVSVATAEANIWSRIEAQPVAVLDEIAWSMRLNELLIWDHTTLAKKRALLTRIFMVRKKSGTPFTLKRVLDLIENRYAITEWWQENATPHTYRLRIFADEIGITRSTLISVPEIVRRFARASQKLSELAVEVDSPGTLFMYPALTVGTHTTIRFGAP